MITLRPISKDNFWDCIDLAVHPEQQSFVTSNAISIAQSKVQPECIPLAIYHEDVMVGFVMYCLDTDDDEYWIYRLMIDQHYQNQGFGLNCCFSYTICLVINKRIINYRLIFFDLY